MKRVLVFLAAIMVIGLHVNAGTGNPVKQESSLIKKEVKISEVAKKFFAPPLSITGACDQSATVKAAWAVGKVATLAAAGNEDIEVDFNYCKPTWPTGDLCESCVRITYRPKSTPIEP